MYKTILVPLDGSKRAEAILPHVEDVARSTGAAIVFLQVVEPPKITGYEGFDPGLYQNELEELTRQAKSYMDSQEDKFRKKGFDCRSRTDHGAIVRSILNAADAEKADLIAMASHGRGGLARVFYGSVAAGVLQRIDRPLLLIRAAFEDE